ncbi:metal-dependent hydrolase family protein [Shewanella subflava]|uniref:Amidohydrolase family protein n=1 Tax=Shewanella subflava TaxID=2986476 RepID=A0ABT3I8K6_9GAMM|nr:amidohydrolase family protein [Shewanella subflava]MCW3172360.1 amidohydrolase family protein [Shewanella subflava]
MRKLSLKNVTAALVVAVSFALPAAAQEPSGPILFTNVNVFDGVNADLIKNANVVVTGNKITSVSTEPLAVAGGMVIDGGGRTLMPGLTDCHWHNMAAYMGADVFTAGLGRLNLVAADGAEKTLMRGFTSVRDPGGPVFELKEAIDEGLFPGPRIYAAGAMISQTSGHADFRRPIDIPQSYSRDLTPLEVAASVSIADGRAQVMQRVRENLMRGAAFIKLMGGGGVASPSDPLDVSQYTVGEIEAAVEVAENWGTYVTVHSYSAKAIQNAIRGGVRNVEHGQMIDKETAKLMQKTDTSVCLQPFYDDEDAVPFPPGSFQQGKYHEMISGTDTAFELAKKYDLLFGFGTDTQGMPALVERQGAMLAKLTRYFKPWEVLKIATSQNYQIFKRSGPRDPYPGENGVVREGAYADLLLVDGNPLENIDLIADPHKNFVLIMKDGKIYKNTLN